MKRSKVVMLFSGLAAVLAAHAATADPAGRYYPQRDYAKVTDVEPITRTVRVHRPRRECWDEDVTYYRPAPYAPTLLGGLLGGVIGHQFGSGSGQAAMTVAGALLGGAIGHDASYGAGAPYTVREPRCQVRDEYTEEQRVEGYRVTYVYHGREYTTRTREHPGSRIPVDVVVRPRHE